MEKPLKGCAKCKYCRAVHCNGGFSFYGCYYKPYHGKRVTEIKQCPKEDGVDCPNCQRKPIDSTSESIESLNDALAKAAEALSEYLAQFLRAFNETISASGFCALPVEFAALVVREKSAVLWAQTAYPKWATMYKRAKKWRVRKKYRDRIMRAYFSEIEE